METNLSQVLQNIAEDVLTLTYLVMDKEGIDKTHSQDDLSYTVEASGNPVITFLYNGYLAYVEDAKSEFTNTLPSVSELREWALKKGIQTDNETLQTIAKAINSLNIAPRPILTMIGDELDKLFETEWADRIFDVIVKKIESLFQD